MRGCCQHSRTHRSAPTQTGQSRRSPLKMWWIFFKRAWAINQRKLVKNVRLGMTLNVGSNLKLEFIPSNFTFSDFSTKFLNKVLFIFVLPWLLMLSTALSSSMLTLMSRSLSITWTSVSPTNHHQPIKHPKDHSKLWFRVCPSVHSKIRWRFLVKNTFSGGGKLVARFDFLLKSFLALNHGWSSWDVSAKHAT